MLRSSTMTWKEAYEEAQQEKARRKEERRRKMKLDDNVNQYAVKFKLEKKKVQRTLTNARQMKAYDQLLEAVESRKAPKLARV